MNAETLSKVIVINDQRYWPDWPYAAVANTVTGVRGIIPCWCPHLVWTHPAGARGLADGELLRHQLLDRLWTPMLYDTVEDLVNAGWWFERGGADDEQR